MVGEEGKIILEHGALLGKARLRRVCGAGGGWSGCLTSRGREENGVGRGEREWEHHDGTKLESTCSPL